MFVFEVNKMFSSLLLNGSPGGLFAIKSKSFRGWNDFSERRLIDEINFSKTSSHAQIFNGIQKFFSFFSILTEFSLAIAAPPLVHCYTLWIMERHASPEGKLLNRRSAIDTRCQASDEDWKDLWEGNSIIWRVTYK